MTERRIFGNWTNPAIRRCDSKRAYRSFKEAEKGAERASKCAGELIIAYQCIDCGRFHIGHADRSQQLARQQHVERPCQHCGGVIPLYRKERATRFGGKALYCSDDCRRKSANDRYRARKGAGKADTSDSSTSN